MPPVEPKINPNDYNEEKHQQASRELNGAVRDLWDAGLTLDDIRRELETSFEFISAETA